MLHSWPAKLPLRKTVFSPWKLTSPRYAQQFFSLFLFPNGSKLLSPPAQGKSCKSQAPEHHTKIGFQGRFWPFLTASAQHKPAVLWVKARLGRGAQEKQTNSCHFSVAEPRKSPYINWGQAREGRKRSRDKHQLQFPSPCLSSMKPALACATWHGSLSGSILQPLTTKAGAKEGINCGWGTSQASETSFAGIIKS